MHPTVRLEKRRARAVHPLLSTAMLLVLALIALPCKAHTVGVSRGEYRAVPSGLEASLSFASTEIEIPR